MQVSPPHRGSGKKGVRTCELGARVFDLMCEFGRDISGIRATEHDARALRREHDHVVVERVWREQEDDRARGESNPTEPVRRSLRELTQLASAARLPPSGPYRTDLRVSSLWRRGKSSRARELTSKFCPTVRQSRQRPCPISSSDSTTLPVTVDNPSVASERSKTALLGGSLSCRGKVGKHHPSGRIISGFGKWSNLTHLCPRRCIPEARLWAKGIQRSCCLRSVSRAERERETRASCRTPPREPCEEGNLIARLNSSILSRASCEARSLRGKVRNLVFCLRAQVRGSYWR